MRELVDLAIRQTEKSYSPYSNFEVGCAIVATDGEVFTGSNIENAAYSPTICAERVAISAAVHKGYRNFKSIAIAGFKKGEEEGHTFPCGVCRQTLAEFVDDDFIIYIAKNKKGDYTEHKFSDILPYSFGKKELLCTEK